MTPEEIKALRELALPSLLDENEKLRAEMDAARGERDEALALLATYKLRLADAGDAHDTTKRTLGVANEHWGHVARAAGEKPDIMVTSLVGRIHNMRAARDELTDARAKAAALDAIEQWLGSTGLPDSFCTVYRSHNNDGKHAGYGCELGDDVEYDAVVSHAPTLAAAISAALQKARSSQ